MQSFINNEINFTQSFVVSMLMHNIVMLIEWAMKILITLKVFTLKIP